jgi:hypothetical protein
MGVSEQRDLIGIRGPAEILSQMLTDKPWIGPPERKKPDIGSRKRAVNRGGYGPEGRPGGNQIINHQKRRGILQPCPVEEIRTAENPVASLASAGILDGSGRTRLGQPPGRVARRDTLRELVPETVQ